MVSRLPVSYSATLYDSTTMRLLKRLTSEKTSRLRASCRMSMGFPDGKALNDYHQRLNRGVS
jgi:hypothetical protein